MEQWETNPDPGEAFVAAALALATPGPDHSKIEALVDGANDDGALAAVVSALGWHALRDVEPLLARWEQAADARRRYLCIAGSAVHRRHPQVGLTRFLEAEDAWVRARASRAAGELGMPAGMEPLRALLGDPEPLVHAQAAQALARLGDHRPEVRRALLEMCEAQDPGPARAAAALARLDPDQARDQFRLWAETAGARQLAIVVVETLGDPETVPQLIAWMEEDALARAAGEAFRAITGADLEYHDLIRDPPDDAGSVPNDDPDDPRVERDLEQDLPGRHRRSSAAGGRRRPSASPAGGATWMVNPRGPWLPSSARAGPATAPPRRCGTPRELPPRRSPRRGRSSRPGTCFLDGEGDRMSNHVYVNGMEVACKASTGKSIAAFPDVCFTPPQAPPTPMGVPLPYPNTAQASDTTDGSKTVSIINKEVMLKNKSYFKTSTGNEAGSAPKKGLVTATNKGKAYFNSWSMDVKIEGENAVRHLDVTTHNHGSVPGNTAAWPFMASMATTKGAQTSKCAKENTKKKKACAGATTKEERCASPECREAMKCELQPYKTTTKTGCCDGQTPHHIVEVHCFTPPAKRQAKTRLEGFERYDDNLAPCVCCDQSSRYKGDHGQMHAIQGMVERSHMDVEGPRSQLGGKDDAWTYGAAKKAGLMAHSETFQGAGCSEACIEAQLDAYHNQCGIQNDSVVRADRSPLKDAQKKEGERVIKKRKRAESADY